MFASPLSVDPAFFWRFVNDVIRVPSQLGLDGALLTNKFFICVTASICKMITLCDIAAMFIRVCVRIAVSPKFKVKG